MIPCGVKRHRGIIFDCHTPRTIVTSGCRLYVFLVYCILMLNDALVYVTLMAFNDILSNLAFIQDRMNRDWICNFFLDICKKEKRSVDAIPRGSFADWMAELLSG